jgi:D-alanyl-D-alanine dipeptidase
MKLYRTIAINECGEALVSIPSGLFAQFDPPPYIALGADYGNESPWMLRVGVVNALLAAQRRLQVKHPGWKIMLFDAYRPRSVQTYMVEREFGIKAKKAGHDPQNLTPEQRKQLSEKVFKYWAIPSDDPKNPPPHTTGAALDLTLADEKGREIDMGSPIDEGTPPAAPDYFAKATDTASQQAHANRILLRTIMEAETFHQHPEEWWHFSRGDQLWAWVERQTRANPTATAFYGRADLLK